LCFWLGLFENPFYRFNVKQAGIQPRKEAPVSAPSTVVNLMDALRRSIEQERPAVKKGRAVEKVGRQSGKRRAS